MSEQHKTTRKQFLQIFVVRELFRSLKVEMNCRHKFENSEYVKNCEKLFFIIYLISKVIKSQKLQIFSVEENGMQITI